MPTEIGVKGVRIVDDGGNPIIQDVVLTGSKTLQKTVLNAISVAAGGTSSYVSVDIKGYSELIIFITADQSYDSLYQLSDGVITSFGTALATAQGATGINARIHPFISGNFSLFGDTLRLAVKNNGTVTGTFTVSILAKA
jgi:hypothetical protein